MGILSSAGGLELSNIDRARVAEVTALDGAISITLAAHQAYGVKVSANYLFSSPEPKAQGEVL